VLKEGGVSSVLSMQSSFDEDNVLATESILKAVQIEELIREQGADPECQNYAACYASSPTSHTCLRDRHVLL
jgi:hypothetical protein